MLKLNRLKRGDTIGIAAVSGPVPDKPNLLKAIKKVEDFGFNVKTADNVFCRKGYLAGEDDERIKGLHDMFKDDEVDGVFCLRGGYGSPRIMNKIDLDIVKNNPKVFLGYSDVTALHIMFNQKADMPTFHGPMPGYDMIADSFDKFSETSLLDCIFSEIPKEIKNPENYELISYVGGKAKGQLVGGNLTLIQYTLGTPNEIDLDGKILFFEDVGEEPYKIDAMLTHLKNCGKLDRCIGFLVGDLKEGTSKNSEVSMDDVIEDVLVPLGKPIISNFRGGHCSPKVTFSLGTEYVMDADNKTIKLTESPFR